MRKKKNNGAASSGQCPPSWSQNWDAAEEKQKKAAAKADRIAWDARQVANNMYFTNRDKMQPTDANDETEWKAAQEAKDLVDLEEARARHLENIAKQTKENAGDGEKAIWELPKPGRHGRPSKEPPRT